MSSKKVFFFEKLASWYGDPDNFRFCFLIMCQLAPIFSKENPLQVPFANPFFFTPNCENLQKKKTPTTSS
jgi:hypothetical protein